MNDHLHIVCLGSPEPPDYGGGIDMYYKIIALAKAGKRITLHYFDYHPGRSVSALKEYCTAVYSYKRKSFARSLFTLLPFIVSSRIDRQLIDRLNADDDPVLLEGIHCTGILPYLQNKERVVVRMHNEEATYYTRLAEVEKEWKRKLYLRYESSMLRRYYRRLPLNLRLACLSETDMQLLLSEYGFRNIYFIPCFIPWQQLAAAEGNGAYCLYHGNLSVSENEAAAAWLVEEVWPQLQIPLLIAGKNPSARLTRICTGHPQVQLEANPSLQRVGELVAAAQLHVLPSMNSTGVKLKLLHALFTGRFCLVNKAGIQGSAIDAGVSIAGEPQEWKELIPQLFHAPFTEEDKKNRRQLLTVYDNKLNAGKLIELLTHYR